MHQTGSLVAVVAQSVRVEDCVYKSRIQQSKVVKIGSVRILISTGLEIRQEAILANESRNTKKKPSLKIQVTPDGLNSDLSK